VLSKTLVGKWFFFSLSWFLDQRVVPLSFRGRWRHCLHCICGLKFLMFFHEENNCINKLSNLAFIHEEQYMWFNVLPPCIYLDFFFIIGIVCLHLAKFWFYHEFGVISYALYSFILFFIFDKFSCDDKRLMNFEVSA